MVGLWPGLPTRVYNTGLSCGETAAAIDQASTDGAAVINMSFGSPYPCYTLYAAVTGASGASVMVAAGGNEFDHGNRAQYPASWPHVLTVAGLDPSLQSSYFSNENAGIDLAAPGEAVLTATPLAYDGDGLADGYTLMDGTSFSAPLAAAAAAWTAALRPDFSPGQISAAVNNAALDLGRRGWDRRFGWGLLQVSDQLASQTPPLDPLEPNDDMQFINGDVFGTRDSPALTLRGRRSDWLTGSLDDWEDPDDVYWLSVPRRSWFRISLRMARGDADLFAYQRWVPKITTRSGTFRRSGLVADSRRPGRRTDTVYVRNNGPASLLAVAVRIFHQHSTLDARYSLAVRRLR
jgi:subtilisin family serine protease